jgi:hypothetical protein
MKMRTNPLTSHCFKKLKSGFYIEPRESLTQTTENNNPTIQPKSPEEVLEDPSIINLIKANLHQISLQINDVVLR